MGAGIPIVRLYRNLHLANLGSPKKLLIAAKLLRGYGYLRDPGYSVLDVSVKLGYRSTRIFAQHAVSVFGLTPSRVRTRLPEADAIKKVLDWLRDDALDPAPI
jgi:methylphosphotriester-DNA--protein-cysteine methyltransferase